MQFDGIQDRMEMVQKLLRECYDIANDTGASFTLTLENCRSWDENINRNINYYGPEEEGCSFGWYQSSWVC